MSLLKLNILIIGDTGNDVASACLKALDNNYIVVVDDVPNVNEASKYIVSLKSRKIFYHIIIFCMDNACWESALWSDIANIPSIKLRIANNPSWEDCRVFFRMGIFDYIDKNKPYADYLRQLERVVCMGLFFLRCDNLPRPLLGLGELGENMGYRDFLEMLQNNGYLLSQYPGENIAFIGDVVVGHSKDGEVFREMEELYPLFPVKYTTGVEHD